MDQFLDQFLDRIGIRNLIRWFCLHLIPWGNCESCCSCAFWRATNCTELLQQVRQDEEKTRCTDCSYSTSGCKVKRKSCTFLADQKWVKYLYLFPKLLHNALSRALLVKEWKEEEAALASFLFFMLLLEPDCLRYSFTSMSEYVRGDPKEAV